MHTQHKCAYKVTHIIHTFIQWKLSILVTLAYEEVCGDLDPVLPICSIKCITYHDKCKEKLVILQAIGIIVIKVRKQWWSPTPADILVGINPYNSVISG